MNVAAPERAHPDRPKPGRLQGRRILITGAASGIGSSTAQLFASEGAAVAVLDRTGNWPEAYSEPAYHCYKVDITDEKSVATAVEHAARSMGGIDGVVNAAGVMLRGRMLDVGIDAWRRVLDINLTGGYIVARACLPWLLEARDATIVNIGSGQALLPNTPGRTAYAASKGGVINLTRSLAAELAPSIRVNSVCPGLVDTPMADGGRTNTGNYAMKRLADPIEIAQAILFLTSRESSYVTGVALAVDGGRSFH